MAANALPDLKAFHRIMILIWVAILSSVVIIAVLGYTLQSMQVITPTAHSEAINQVLFLLAIALAFAILFFKRSLFLPEKIARFSANLSLPEKADIVLSRLRRNYITVWALGEAIALLGFVDYLFTGNQQYFLVYAVVSVYSVLVNMPRIAIAENSMELLEGSVQS